MTRRGAPWPAAAATLPTMSLRQGVAAAVPTATFVIQRVALTIVTLWLLATIVFLLVNVLPGDVGRTILGPFASQETVDALNQKLGVDRPLLIRYFDLLRGLVTLDLGNSFGSGQPVVPELASAIARSAKLAGLALVLTVPLGVLAGMYAAFRRDRLADRLVVLFAVSTSAIPAFVTGTVMIVVIGVQLKWLPVIANPRDDADIVTQLRYMLMPACALVLVYVGYIARMARASTIEVLESDFIRTAYMKGLTTRQVITRHVLRNAMIPTVAVIAVQVGYLFGGIVAVEKVFNYPGMGQMLLFAAGQKDIPILAAGVIAVGVVYAAASLVADLVIAWMNPRLRLQGD